MNHTNFLINVLKNQDIHILNKYNKLIKKLVRRDNKYKKYLLSNNQTIIKQYGGFKVQKDGNQYKVSNNNNNEICKYTSNQFLLLLKKFNVIKTDSLIPTGTKLLYKVEKKQKKPNDKFYIYNVKKDVNSYEVSDYIKKQSEWIISLITLNYITPRGNKIDNDYKKEHSEGLIIDMLTNLIEFFKKNSEPAFYINKETRKLLIQLIELKDSNMECMYSGKSKKYCKKKIKQIKR